MGQNLPTLLRTFTLWAPGSYTLPPAGGAILKFEVLVGRFKPHEDPDDQYLVIKLSPKEDEELKTR